MAGRGRQSTLPAWMTADGGAGGISSGATATIPSHVHEQGQYDDHAQAEPRASSNGHSGEQTESRSRGSREERPRKSRSRDRDHRSSRSNRSR